MMRTEKLEDQLSPRPWKLTADGLTIKDREGRSIATRPFWSPRLKLKMAKKNLRLMMLAPKIFSFVYWCRAAVSDGWSQESTERVKKFADWAIKEVEKP